MEHVAGQYPLVLVDGKLKLDSTFIQCLTYKKRRSIPLVCLPLQKMTLSLVRHVLTGELMVSLLLSPSGSVSLLKRSLPEECSPLCPAQFEVFCWAVLSSLVEKGVSVIPRLHATFQVQFSQCALAEPLHGTLFQLLQKRPAVAESVMFQLLFGLCQLQKMVGFYHGNINFQSVMYRKLASPVKLSYHMMSTGKFYQTECSYLVQLTDFTQSSLDYRQSVDILPAFHGGADGRPATTDFRADAVAVCELLEPYLSPEWQGVQTALSLEGLIDKYVSPILPENSCKFFIV